MKENNKDLNINWGKFKVKATSKHLESARNSYIEFCKMLDEVDFELVSDYIGALKKVDIIYKFNDCIKLSITSDKFKRRTYKTIINFKNNLIKNKDEFIEFVGLTNGNTLIAKIKTLDKETVNIGISSYAKFNESRRSFYDSLKQINGSTTDHYINNDSKMNIYINNIKLNPSSPNNFKTCIYKSIINFKKELIKNNDKFIEFVGITSKNFLIAKIKTFDNGEVNIDINSYNHFNKSRKNTYDYCKERGYKILRPYVGNDSKILIDFNCGHEAHWIRPSDLKQDKKCPVCDESKGERAIRSYLENNNIDFIQEYKFENCRYKRSLPFDFYIKDYNLCIEYDGGQHYKPISYFGGKKTFRNTQIRDKIKNKFCEDNGINLLRIPYWELNNIKKILDEEFQLKEKFKLFFI